MADTTASEMVTTTTSPPAAAPGTTHPITQLRPPQVHRANSKIHASLPDFKLPDIPWLCDTWHVTHSTLPMWKNKQNVCITYKHLPGDKLDDLVTYQSLGETKVSKVQGIDSPDEPGSYNWRGKGWLKIASSHWELLGWGGASPGEEWAVTYFAKTLFTPAGIDVYSRSPKGLPEATLTGIRNGLKALGQETAEFGKLADTLFEVKTDGASA